MTNLSDIAVLALLLRVLEGGQTVAVHRRRHCEAADLGTVGRRTIRIWGSRSELWGREESDGEMVKGTMIDFLN